MLIVHHSLISFVYFRAILSSAFFVHCPGILCRFCLLFRILSGLLRSLARNLIAVVPVAVILNGRLVDGYFLSISGRCYRPPKIVPSIASFQSECFYIRERVCSPLPFVEGYRRWLIRKSATIVVGGLRSYNLGLANLILL